MPHKYVHYYYYANRNTNKTTQILVIELKLYMFLTIVYQFRSRDGPEIKGPPYLENHANSWKLILDDYSYTKIACNFNIIDNNYYINIANSIYKSLDIDAVINSDVYISAPAEVIIYLSEMLLETDLNEKHLIASPI